jgi:hypothetical protein
MIRRAFVSVLVAVLLGLNLTACGGDSTGSSSPDITGAYTLAGLGESRVGGSLVTLPVVTFNLSEGGRTVVQNEITGGNLTLKADGTFEGAITFRLTRGGEVRDETTPISGSYERIGTSLKLTSRDGALTDGQAGANEVRLSSQTETFVYRR